MHTSRMSLLCCNQGGADWCLNCHVLTKTSDWFAQCLHPPLPAAPASSWWRWWWSKTKMRHKRWKSELTITNAVKVNQTCRCLWRRVDCGRMTVPLWRSCHQMKLKIKLMSRDFDIILALILAPFHIPNSYLVGALYTYFQKSAFSFFDSLTLIGWLTTWLSKSRRSDAGATLPFQEWV